MPFNYVTVSASMSMSNFRKLSPLTDASSRTPVPPSACHLPTVSCCRLSSHIQSIRTLAASASQHAVNNEREAALAAANGAGLDPTTATSPPNYEELDPPPAYSVLFPNQKAASSNTLNALDGAVASTTAAAAAAAAAAATATTAAAAEQQQAQQQTGDEPTN